MPVKSRSSSLIVATLGMLVAAASAFAHHSSAMFDQTKNIKLEGVVYQYEWGNPHVLVLIDAADGQGGTARYALECSSPNSLSHQGWKVNSFKAGDHVTVEFFPLRDGRPGGMLVTIGLPSGRILNAW